MTTIHPTATVARAATIGAHVIIGPGVVVAGPSVIGDGCWIGAGAMVGVPPEVRTHPHGADWLETGSLGVRLGAGSVLREAVQVHGGWREVTTIGADAFIMNQAYVAHDCVLGDGVTLASGARLGGHAVVGDGANLGLGVVVHQRRTIGTLAMVGMGGVVTRDIDDYVMAFGSPARARRINVVGMERSGIDGATIEQVVARFSA